MKLNKQILIPLTLITILAVGVFVTSVSAPPKKKLKMKWRPSEYYLSSPVPDPWNCEVYFVPPLDLALMNPSTILLEGMFSPIGDPYPAGDRPRVIIPFDGYDVLCALLLKAGHMVPGIEYPIDLEITGELLDGTPFEGTGKINLLVPENPGP